MDESIVQNPATPEATHRRRERLVCALALAIVLLVSVLHRLPPLMNARAIDSDAAVPALQARHILHGEWSWNLWGSGYQGSLTSILLAGVFCVFGSSAESVVYSVFALHLLATVLAFDVIRRHLGSPWRAALCVMPLAITTWPATSIAAYASPPRQTPFTLIFLAIWLYDAASRWRRPVVPLVAAGLAVGGAIWGDLMSLLLVPGVAVFAVMAVRQRGADSPKTARWLGLMAGVILGILLLILARHSSEAESTQATLSIARIAQNFRLLYSECLPFTLGWKIMANPDDVLGHHLVRAAGPVYALQWIGGVSLLALSAAGGALSLWRRTPPGLRRLGLLGIISMVATLGAFLASVMPEDVWAARYLAPLVLAAPFALAPLAARVRTSTFALLIAPYLLGVAVAGWVGYGPMVRGLVPQVTPRGAAQDEMRLAEFLRERNIRYAKANYWLAYRLTFLWGENAIVVPLNPTEDRYPRWRAQVEAAPVVAATFHPSEPRAKAEQYEQFFQERKMRYQRYDVAGFTVLVVDQR
jgi:hypothetical protein